jgi:amino acid adenylation domain-containing protein
LPQSDYGDPVEQPFEAFPASAVGTSIIARFEFVAARHAERLAIQSQSSSMTYRELSEFASRISSAVAAVAERRDRPVGIMLDRDTRYPAAMLGVLAAGSAYAALDASHPFERNRTIVERAGICTMVTAGAVSDVAAKLSSSPAQTINIDTLTSSQAAQAAARPAANDLGYIYFTSGSQGTPKGVAHSHRNMLHMIRLYANALHLTPEDRLTMLYPASTMAAGRDIFAALLTGASLHMLSPAQSQPEGLVEEIRRRGITIYHSTPGLLRRISEVLGANERLDRVRIASLGGDRVEWSDIDLVWRVFSPRVFAYMALTSTETHLRCHWFIDKSLRHTTIRPPVGWPLPEMTLSIVGENGRPVADGEFGEILVTSRYIANGYWDDPALTSEAFRRDPHDKNRLTFKTGDIGRRRPDDGLIEFAGRKDHQVKLHGYRIDIGEVEDALKDCDGVQDAAVVVRKGDAGAPRALAAYVEPAPGVPGLQRRDLLARLTDRLPRYMIPATISVIERLPRLPSLKVDRISIARMDATSAAQAAHPVDDPLIDKLIGIFSSILGDVRLTPEDNVSSLGGDSLQAIRIALETERHFGIAITPEVFETLQTIRELARWIATR